MVNVTKPWPFTFVDNSSLSTFSNYARRSQMIFFLNRLWLIFHSLANRFEPISKRTWYDGFVKIKKSLCMLSIEKRQLDFNYSIVFLPYYFSPWDFISWVKLMGHSKNSLPKNKSQWVALASVKRDIVGFCPPRHFCCSQRYYYYYYT